MMPPRDATRERGGASPVQPALVLQQLPPLDPESSAPLHVQLAERLAAPIRGAQAALAGCAMPTEAQCMAHFGVSRPTVRQAMGHLVAAGLVTRGRGKGTFVAAERLNHDVSMAFEDEMRAARRSIRFHLLRRRLDVPPERVRTKLDLPPGAAVEYVERLRFLDGEVFAYEQRWFAPAVSRHVTQAMLEEMAIISLLGAAMGQPPARIVNTVRCLPADPAVAKLLGVGRRTALLETEHTYYAESGAPLLHGSVRFHGERFEFTLDSEVRRAG
jgi:GntR family transcriptional regulator